MGTNSGGLWTASFGEIGASLKALEDNGFTLDHLAKIRSDKELAKKVARFIIKEVSSLQNEGDIILWFTNFYKLWFNLTVDLSDVKIPAYQFGYDGVLIVAENMTIKHVVDYSKKKIAKWLCDHDLSDKDVTNNDRDPKKGSYAIRYRYRQEADEEWQSISADKLKEKGFNGCTLLERFLIDFVYFGKENGQHLDQGNATLCTGSRGRYGDVWTVGWSTGGMKVGTVKSDHSAIAHVRPVLTC